MSAFIYLTPQIVVKRSRNFMESLELKWRGRVPVSLLRNILEQCKSPQDTGMAFRVLQDYRVYVSRNPHLTRL